MIPGQGLVQGRSTSGPTTTCTLHTLPASSNTNKGKGHVQVPTSREPDPSGLRQEADAAQVQQRIKDANTKCHRSIVLEKQKTRPRRVTGRGPSAQRRLYMPVSRKEL